MHLFYILQNDTEYLSKPVPQNKSYRVTVCEFTWCAWNKCCSHENSWWKSFIPLVN